MLIVVISMMCFPSTVFAEKDLSDITFSGGASDFFDSLRIDGYQINDCTKEMRGKGWSVKNDTIFLNNYNGSGIHIRAYEDKISQIQVAFTTDSKIRDGLYGINCNVGLLLHGPGTDASDSLDIEAGSCGIYCSGLLGFYNGRFNIKCIDNGKAIAGINQAHFKIEHCTIAKNATVVVDWKATSWNDFYGIKGVSIISGSDDGIGKLSVATENKGKGNAYATDMSDSVIKTIKSSATVYPGDEQHFFVNMVGIDRLDLTVVEPEIGKTPSKAVSVQQSGVGVEIAGWMEKGKGTYLKDTETYKASTEYIPQFLVKLSVFCEYYPDVEVTVNGKTATFNKMQANNNKVISDISFTTGSSNSKISEVQFENFTWLTNGQEYTQSNPKVILKSDFPGTITKQQIKINGQVMEADTFAGENIELAVYIKLNDGYTWNSSVNAWLDGKVADDFLKISSMGENERVFIWKHTTEYTDKIKITEQSPETLEYTNGEDVKLYVKATGASNYQWSMYEERGVGIKTVRGFYKIDGATSNEYIIKNADSSLDGKEYRCTLAVDDETIFTKTITLKLVEKKTEQPTQTDEPAKTEEPTKTEEPVKTEEPTTTEEKTWTKASEWAEEELDKANKLDVIPEIFKKQDLTQNITRKEFAHVAVKLYEKLTGNKATAVANNPFKDTDDVEVLKAYNVGITQGTGADTFTPDALITREQMATMMTRALIKAGIDTKVDLEKVTKFADDGGMHDWGKESIYYMSSIEIIKGIGNNTFNVLGNATREQALLISVRSAEKFAK